MKTEKQQNKNEVKMPKFVHPAQFAQYMYQRHSMKKQHDKMIDDINGIEQNRLNIADFASKIAIFPIIGKFRLDITVCAFIFSIIRAQ